jgi:iron complex outermembrane receptor protein
LVVSAYKSNRQLLDVAAPITVLEKKDLTRFDNTTLIPILNTITGVKLDYYTYGDYRLNIRGGALAQPSVHSSGYRMYWNEIPITSASGGNPLGGLDVNAISNLEIIKGPGSSMYGAGFGGTVLVTTERANIPGTTINSDLMVGGFGTLRATGGVRTDWSKGNISFQYTHVNSDGYRKMSNSNSNVYNLFGQYYFTNKGTLSYLLNYENRDMNISGDLDSLTFHTAPTTANTIQPTKFGPDKITAGLGYKHRFNEYWSLSVGAHYINNKGKFIMSFPFFAIFDKEPSQSLLARTTISYQRKLGASQLKINAGLETGGSNDKGISYDSDFTSNNDAQITNINEATTNMLIGFAHADMSFPSGWIATAGISYNRYSYDVKSGTNTPTPLEYTTDVNNFAPRISLLKKIKGVSFYTSLSSGFSPPAAGIFNDFLNFDGSINNNLKAGTGLNWEIGSRGTNKSGLLFYDVTYYNQRIQDAIISRLFEISPGVNAERKTNAGEINQQGIEALAGLNLGRDNSFWKGTQLRVGYTFNDFTYRDYKTFITEFDQNFDPIFVPVDYSGKEIPGTFRHSWLVVADVKTKVGMYLNLSLNTYSDTYLTNENLSTAEAYSLVNVKVGWNKFIGSGKWQIHPYVGVNNLGDELYSSLTAYNSTFGGFFNPGYRRQFYVGLALSLKL